jgi:hypothetical protein
LTGTVPLLQRAVNIARTMEDVGDPDPMVPEKHSVPHEFLDSTNTWPAGAQTRYWPRFAESA